MPFEPRGLRRARGAPLGLLALACGAAAAPVSLPPEALTRRIQYLLGPAHLLTRPAGGAAARWDLPPPRETHRRLRVRVDGDRVVCRIHQVFFNASYQLLDAVLLAPDPGAQAELRLTVRQPALEAPPTPRPLGAEAAATMAREYALTGGNPSALGRTDGPAIAYGPFRVGRGEYLKVDWRFETQLPAPEGGLRVLAVAPGGAPPRPLALHHLELDFPASYASQVYSPTHRLLERPEGKDRVVLNPVQANPDPAQPFVVMWPPKPNVAGVVRGRDPEGQALGLALVPPVQGPVERAQRCWVVALDTGGSLRGAPFHEAVDLVARILDLLAPEDLFDLVPFAAFPQPYQRHPVLATDENKSRAIEFLRRREPRGAVNFEAALLTALEVAGDAPVEAERAVLLLTDGRPTLGEVRAASILEQRPAVPVPIFPVASGADTDYFFLELIARRTGGAATFLEPDEDAIPLLRARVRPSGGPDRLRLELDGEALSEPPEMRHGGARVVTFPIGEAKALRVGARRFPLAKAQDLGLLPYLVHRGRELGAQVWKSLLGDERFPGGALSFRLLGLVPGTPRPRILHTVRDGVGPLGRARMLALQGLLDHGIYQPVVPGPNRAWSGNRFFLQDTHGVWVESGLDPHTAKIVEYGSVAHQALTTDPQVAPHLGLDRQVALFGPEGTPLLVRPTLPAKP